MDAAIDQFIMLNPSRLSQIVERVQGITNGNTFVSSDLYSCSREKHRHCVQPGGIYSSTMNNAYWIISGIHVGCSIVETWSNSTLECLYNQTCINLLQVYVSTASVYISDVINVIVLDSVLPSRFVPNIMIQELVNEHFIKSFQYEISYLEFYNQCAPSVCLHAFEKRSNFLIIISRILALWGGLTLSFGFLAPCFVKLLFKINAYRKETRVNIIAKFI
ncbi:unnamed protein product [Rotaria magnacalcarata]|uniref:Uncharacterized protein n=1 Tax=Rotaria magnacalcarata TaxID=392030 RepID=A0A815ZZL7_9BILA|nr:unnamed protein product [Rotaria magnacalcarata]CAF1600044.1 unnamed protein product [Rotaria magnacalcarata]CAF2059510.1 unnamed protein product [Rotaria magnacalcarata]CAF3972067.1 unnamed protein product [Rotaria magnacalcarata]CAF4406715.1 unnamed protein product [Rotaria magnacalcarata]